ncbi:MAG: hypothetical protein D6791_03295 [Chloroflexi bacterium]|nr:MAG: hypothetical protein D6791_03295 [Chloroflexota bacterium]
MQGDWERCGVCGAKLPPVEKTATAGPQAQSQQPLGDLPYDRTAIINITLYVIAVIVGIILIGVMCVLLFRLIL